MVILIRTSSRALDSRMLATAACQHGVVSARQLCAQGFDHAAIQRRIRAGMLHRVHPGVYVVGREVEHLDLAARAMCGVLAGGDCAAASRQVAAEFLGIWDRRDEAMPLTITSPSIGRSRRGPPWLQFCRAPLSKDEVVPAANGVPITQPLRTILDLGHELSEQQVAAVLHEATFRGIVDVSDLRRILAERGPVPGTRAVRRAVAIHRAGGAGTRSRSEDQFLLLTDRARVGAPVVNTRDSTNVRGIEADFVWTDARVIFEVDGGGHARPGAAAHDARRDEALMRAGWTVVRVPAGDVWHRPWVVVQLLRTHLTPSLLHAP